LNEAGAATVLAGTGLTGVPSCPFCVAGLSGFGVAALKESGVFAAALDAAGRLPVSPGGVGRELVEGLVFAALRATFRGAHLGREFRTMDGLAKDADTDATVGSAAVDVKGVEWENFPASMAGLMRSGLGVVTEEICCAGPPLPLVVHVA